LHNHDFPELFECRLYMLRVCPVGVQWPLTGSSAHGFYSLYSSPPCPASSVGPAPLKTASPLHPGFRTAVSLRIPRGSKHCVLAPYPLAFGHAAERQRSVRWRLRSGFHARAWLRNRAASLSLIAKARDAMSAQCPIAALTQHDDEDCGRSEVLSTNRRRSMSASSV